MSWRKSVCLPILLFVALAPFCQLPVGHGSFTSVYGPHTPLQEYGISLRLTHAMAAMAILVRACLPVGSDRTHSESDAEPELSVIDRSSLISILRC